MDYTLKRLNESNREKIREHFLRLDDNSRASRFCVLLNDYSLENYVKKINFSNGIYGLFNANLDIIGVGECLFFKENLISKAEVGFTVEKEYQGKGLGNKLMKRIVQLANSHDVKEIKMYCLKTNQASLHLAKKYNLIPQYDGTEISASLTIPNSIPMIATVNEQIDENLANMELLIKYNNIFINKHMEQIKENTKTINKMFIK